MLIKRFDGRVVVFLDIFFSNNLFPAAGYFPKANSLTFSKNAFFQRTKTLVTWEMVILGSQ